MLRYGTKYSSIFSTNADDMKIAHSALFMYLTLESHHLQQKGKNRTFLKPIHTSARCLKGFVLNETALQTVAPPGVQRAQREGQGEREADWDRNTASSTSLRRGGV